MQLLHPKNEYYCFARIQLYVLDFDVENLADIVFQIWFCCKNCQNVVNITKPSKKITHSNIRYRPNMLLLYCSVSCLFIKI